MNEAGISDETAQICNVIISNKEWHRKYTGEVSARSGSKIVYIDDKEKVTYGYLKQLCPRYVFFPHWSNIIPVDVYDNFECVIFHMTDLPFGRGGSPLQNLIERSIYETKLSAIRCRRELDGGEVYMKRPLSLWGTAEEIYLRAAELTKEMMVEIATSGITPVPQTGEPVVFRRRKPEQGDISGLGSLEKVFDYIRMLDADGYPSAFLEKGKLRLEFERDVRLFGRLVQRFQLFQFHLHVDRNRFHLPDPPKHDLPCGRHRDARCDEH